MACFRTTFRSRVLDMDTYVNVTIPYDHCDPAGSPGRCDKTLYLLHGLKQNADAWTRLSSAERFAYYYGYALVMPEVQRSFYTDMAYGPRYFTYLSEELPEMMEKFFRIPQDPAHTFAGGLSMGGYGALKCALQRPDRFAGAMCFSSGFYALDRAAWLKKNYYQPNEELVGILGPDLVCEGDNYLTGRIENYPKDARKPYLYLSCGTEDPLYDQSTKMRDTLRENGFDLRYEEWPGIHDWRFWDVALEKGMLYINECLAGKTE